MQLTLLNENSGKMLKYITSRAFHWLDKIIHKRRGLESMELQKRTTIK